MAATGTAGRKWSRIYSSSGIYDYFDRFFSGSGIPSKLILAAFFMVFLIVPILGGPSNDSAGRLESGIVFSGLNFVFYTTGAVLFRFNRKLTDGRIRRSGTVVLAMIVLSISVYSILALLSLVLGSEVVSVLRVSSSIVIILPPVFVITLLVESVIRRGIVQTHSRVPLLLVFLTILLIMYTFATIYFVNGLLVRTDIFAASPTFLPVSFSDSLFFSGLIFTTLGSTDIFPVGIGKAVMLFESVSGYLVLGFLTAIFIQAIISTREGGRS
jgi:Ion channel